VPEAPRPPDCITLEAHRDRGHPVERVVRWIVVALLAALAIAGLANAFGQRHSVKVATAPQARLELTAPAALRSGLLFQGRFRISAAREIGKPTLILDPGWFDAVSVNAVVPEPTGSWSEGGRVAFAFPTLRGGASMTVYLDLQVNPTTAGRRTQGVELRDGDRTIVTIDRTVNIFP
jgi:hypothetical protein